LEQRLQNVLAVKFTCAGTESKGDVVEITGNNTVAVPSGAGSVKVVGTIDRLYGTECTVSTRFRERRDDRVSGAAVEVGPFVFNSAGKVIAYDDQTHSPVAVRGLVIKAAGDADIAVETLEL
jgi:ribosomal protein L35AE/L33A